MAIYGLPDGTQAEFPDTMSEDEVKAVLRKKFPAPVDPQAGAKSVVAEMGPIEGAVTAFGENARHALRKAANFSLPHTFKSLGNRDEDVAAESAALAPLNAAFPKSAMAGGLNGSNVSTVISNSRGATLLRRWRRRRKTSSRSQASSTVRRFR